MIGLMTNVLKYLQTFIRDPLMKEQFLSLNIWFRDQKNPTFPSFLIYNMMCVATGKERTTKEYADLLKMAGWTNTKTLFSHSGQMGVILALQMISVVPNSFKLSIHLNI